MTENNKNSDYRFLEKGHRHEILIDGLWKPITGVTTIISIIAKPALIQWSADEAVNYIRNWAESHSIPKDTVLFLESKSLLTILEEARLAHRRKKEKAGQKGTDVHAEIEKIIKDAIEKDKGYVGSNNVHTKLTPQIEHFLHWCRDNKVKFLESEVHIWSKKLFVAGICDFVCKIEENIWIGDIKTGNRIYPEYLFQTAGYQLLFEEMDKYQNIKGHIIINLKRDGTFEEKRSVINEDNKTAFLSALSIYRIMAKVNGQIL